MDYNMPLYAIVIVLFVLIALIAVAIKTRGKLLKWMFWFILIVGVLYMLLLRDPMR